jgi:hypothetical protein
MQHLDLTDGEAAALIKELANAIAEGVRAAASNPSQETTARVRSEPGPPRAAAGRRSAGSIMGRLTPAQTAEARRRRAQGATLAELARSYDVSESTIFTT